MNARLWLAAGTVYGFLSVALGAFGAHALRTRLSPDMFAVYKTAVDYQFDHALALLAVGLLSMQRPSATLNAAGTCFAAGIIFFSGSLYGLAMTGIRAFGPATPFGGLLFLAGWALLLVSVVRKSP